MRLRASVALEHCCIARQSGIRFGREFTSSVELVGDFVFGKVGAGDIPKQEPSPYAEPNAEDIIHVETHRLGNISSGQQPHTGAQIPTGEVGRHGCSPLVVLS